MHHLGMSVRMWAVLFAIAALPGCAAGESDGEVEARPPAAGPSEAPFVNGGPCPAAVDPELPEDAGCVSTAVEDDRRLFVYAMVDGTGAPTTWHLELQAPDGDIEQDLDVGADYPRAVGASDVDGDGTLEWWVKLGDYASHGAPWARLNLFIPSGDRLEPLAVDGVPLDVNYGGISRLGEGADCRSGDLVIMRAEAQNPRNTRWEVSERTYDVEGAVATPMGRTQDVIVVDNYVDPAIRRYFRIECNGDVFIPF